MNAPTSAAAEKPVPTNVAPEARHSVDKGNAPPRAKVPVDIDTAADAERMKSTLLRITSHSMSELEGLAAELHEVREFLRSEGERVQREIANYAQLNHSALAAVRIITETIGPWKSSAQETDAPILERRAAARSA